MATPTEDALPGIAPKVSKSFHKVKTPGRNEMNSQAFLRNLSYKLLLAGIACFVLAMAAQETSKTTTTSGQSQTQVQVQRAEVVDVSGNNLVVRMENGEIRHLVVPDSARATVDGKDLSVHDLKPGMKLERTVTTTTTPQTVTTVRSVEGRVIRTRPPNSVTLQLADGTAKTYQVPEGQKFMIDGQERTVFELRKNMEIKATAVTEHPAEIVEQTSNVTGTAPPPPSPPPTQPVVGVILIEKAPAPQAAAPPAETAQATPPTKIPQTASPLPLIGLLGALMLAAGFGLRVVRLRAQ
jgi:hypothetical protein